MALEGREGGRGAVGWLEHQSAAATPPLAEAAPHGLGGTALAPQLQPLLCSLVCEINAPHLLFLLPGNHARQRITPGELFSPARFPGRDTWNIKHDELVPLGQVTEQLPSAQLEPLQLPGANLLPFPIPFSRQRSPALKPLGKHRDFFPPGRAGASPCCQAAARLLSFLGWPWVARSLSAGRGEGSAPQQRHPPTPCP